MTLHYSYYYDYALQMIVKEEDSIPFYKLFRLKGIEMAIWPLLHIKEGWCESNICGSVSSISNLQYIEFLYN